MSTILVLDDHPTNREFLTSLLSYQGHRMLEAEDGRRGLELARSHHPDLVIADVLMPVMDGYEFARRLRADPVTAGTPVIFYTANYLERDAQVLASNCGVDVVLTKPADAEVILGAVARTLDRAVPQVARRDAPVEFDREHQRLLTDKLAQKVRALEASSLRLIALVRLGQHLAAETSIERLVATFCREAREIVGARIGAVGIFDESGSVLRRYVVEGPDAADVLSVDEPRRGILGAVLADVHSLRVRRPDSIQSAVLPASHRGAAFLGAAIRTATRQYGWLYFVEKPDQDEFSEEDELVASLLATKLGLAYENATRLEEIRRYASELERRVAERTEALTRSNADLAQFAYVASHDLQEPLRMVASYTELLAKRYRGRLDAAADEFIDFACDGARRMQQLILDLLAYSRIEAQSDAVGPVLLDEVLDRALANLHQPIQDAGAVISRGTLPVVKVVGSQFVQLFQNLIGNAVKFRGQAAPAVRVTAERLDGEWRISVADNGIGIAPEFDQRIFVIFQRLHSRAEYPGTGMGLAICKRVVERHGGRLWVDSVEGAGATFSFTIPDAAGQTIATRAA